MENRWKYKAISAYKEVDNPDEWKTCPNCGLKPLVWVFDNGRSTACGCGKSDYDHFSIYAESIMSHHNRKDVPNYDPDALRKNWNYWVSTGDELFVHASKRHDGRY